MAQLLILFILIAFITGLVFYSFQLYPLTTNFEFKGETYELYIPVIIAFTAAATAFFCWLLSFAHSPLVNIKIRRLQAELREAKEVIKEYEKQIEELKVKNRALQQEAAAITAKEVPPPQTPTEPAEITTTAP